MTRHQVQEQLVEEPFAAWLNVGGGFPTLRGGALKARFERMFLKRYENASRAKPLSGKMSRFQRLWQLLPLTWWCRHEKGKR
jgi:hypothetical protein